MPPKALLLGGTGQIGRAVALRFLDHGWDVVAASRGQRPVPEELLHQVEHVRLDREDDDALREGLGDGADVLVDIVAFETHHARQLVSLAGHVGSLVVVSTGGVYADDEGRSLDAQSANEFPDFGGPIPESQRTVTPGDDTYHTKKAAIEQILLRQDAVPATIVRPWAIHGPGATVPREWHFVKRALDGRRFVLLVDRGENRFHTTSVDNLAELVRLAAERRKPGAFNCGDPGPPRVIDIARAIAAALDHKWTDVLIDRVEPWHREREALGDTPWSALKPLVADMSLAEIELGYQPVTTYEESVRGTCEWLVAATHDADWRDVFPELAKYAAESFDYDAEDEFLRRLTDG